MNAQFGAAPTWRGSGTSTKLTFIEPPRRIWPICHTISGRPPPSLIRGQSSRFRFGWIVMSWPISRSKDPGTSLESTLYYGHTSSRCVGGQVVVEQPNVQRPRSAAGAITRDRRDRPPVPIRGLPVIWRDRLASRPSAPALAPSRARPHKTKCTRDLQRQREVAPEIPPEGISPAAHLSV